MNKFQWSAVVLSLLCANMLLADETAGGGQSNSTEEDSKVRKVNLGRSVVTATGFEQDIKDAPASMSIVTGEELRDRPVRDIGDAIRDLPGVSVDYQSSSYGGYMISIRGMPASYTLMLLDGARQGVDQTTFPNDTYSQQFFMPPIAAIDRIEVIRGPASTIYGTDAIGGVVNIITKKSFDKWSANATLNTTLEEQPYFGHSYGVSLYGAGPLDRAKKWNLQLRAKETFTQDPRENTIPIPDSINLDAPTLSIGTNYVGTGKSNSWQAGGRLGYDMNESNYFYLDFSHLGQYFDSTLLGTDNKFYSYNTILMHKGSYGNIRTNTSLSYNVAQQIARSRLGQTAIAQHRSIIPFWRMNLNIGAQYTFDTIAALGDTVFGGDYTDSVSRHQFSIFAEDEWAVLDNLFFTIGLRGNYSNLFAFNVSPRGYLVYKALEASTIGDLTFKGGVSTGYKAPNITSALPGWVSSTGRGLVPVYGNPDLKPESSINYEITAMHETDWTNIEITGFYTDFTNKILSQTVATGQPLPAGYICPNNKNYTSCQTSYNIDKAISYGLELFTQLKPISVGVGDLGVNLSYTWNKNKATSGEGKGLPLTGVPEHTLNMAINYTYKDLGVWIRGEYRAKQFRTNVAGRNGNYTNATFDAWKANNPGRSEYYNPYFLLHLGANYNFTQRLRANFGIYNLLNQSFFDYYVYQNTQNQSTLANNYANVLEGRRYYIQLSYDF
uniref:Ferric enterobactin uptake receptor n=1 Tax=uncultured Helicobacter sp. TaxID=175537 RepID=A0A650EKW6_9HELI|nr:ferric enterobactin uptake receptor [uncultured Helicobacter sp.]